MIYLFVNGYFFQLFATMDNTALKGLFLPSLLPSLYLKKTLNANILGTKNGGYNSGQIKDFPCILDSRGPTANQQDK